MRDFSFCLSVIKVWSLVICPGLSFVIWNFSFCCPVFKFWSCESFYSAARLKFGHLGDPGHVKSLGIFNLILSNFSIFRVFMAWWGSRVFTQTFVRPKKITCTAHVILLIWVPTLNSDNHENLCQQVRGTSFIVIPYTGQATVVVETWVWWKTFIELGTASILRIDKYIVCILTWYRSSYSPEGLGLCRGWWGGLRDARGTGGKVRSSALQTCLLNVLTRNITLVTLANSRFKTREKSEQFRFSCWYVSCHFGSSRDSTNVGGFVGMLTSLSFWLRLFFSVEYIVKSRSHVTVSCRFF